MSDTTVSGQFKLDIHGAEDQTSESVEVPSRSTLDGFAAEAIDRPGITTRHLDPWSLVEVQTANTLYHVTVLDPQQSLILIQGGSHFPVATEARLSGSSFGGSLLKLGFIGCGMHLEVTTAEIKIVTSRVQSVTVRESELPGPF